MSESLELAKKLKRLADRTEGGEKYNAEKALQKIMKKHDITEDMLTEDELFDVAFRVRPAQRQLFRQLSAMVMGYSNFHLFWSKSRPTIAFVKVTKLQEIELRAMFSFYWKQFELQLELFTDAFIMRNHLYPADGPTSSSDALTVEQLEKTVRALQISENLPASHYRKQIK